jgi:hypothetical protein
VCAGKALDDWESADGVARLFNSPGHPGDEPLEGVFSALCNVLRQVLAEQAPVAWCWAEGKFPPGLLVIVRNSTLACKGEPTGVRQIVHGLGVMYLLEGNAGRSETRLLDVWQVTCCSAITAGPIQSGRMAMPPGPLQTIHALRLNPRPTGWHSWIAGVATAALKA